MVSAKLAVALAAFSITQVNANQCRPHSSGHPFTASTNLTSSAVATSRQSSSGATNTLVQSTSSITDTLGPSASSVTGTLSQSASDTRTSLIQSASSLTDTATQSISDPATSLIQSASTVTASPSVLDTATSLLQSASGTTDTFHPSTSLCGDQCAHDVAAVGQNPVVSAAHLASCNDWFAVTTRPPPFEVSTTTTVISTITSGQIIATTDALPSDLTVRRRTVTQPNKPGFASACEDDVAFTSACECFGATVSTVAGPRETTTTTITEASYVTARGDSPPFTPTTPVEMPSGTDWTSTYSYDTEVELPTFPPQNDVYDFPTPTDDIACAVDPAASGVEYYVADVDKGFITNNNGKPAPLSPQNQAEAQAMAASAADPSSWTYPVYKLEKPSGAPSGMYDLVLISGKGNKYVALGEGGSVVFTSESTNGILQNKLITTVFKINCDGGMSIEFNGAKWAWSGTDAGTELVSGQGSIIITNKDALIASAQQAAQSSEAAGQVERRSYYNDPVWGRCPSAPENVFSAPKPDRRNNDPNGCGSASFKVPDLNFKPCCDTHDNCFDDCDRTFHGCNLDFLVCMRGRCNDYLRSFWTAWKWPLCNFAATGYATAVQVGARGAFYDATRERCKCDCRPAGGVAQGYCNGRCIITGGNDNNNCGGCGNTCPYRTHCSGGACACDKDQCGNLCLNLENHPRNCGSCGNVCSSGYCVGGQCWEVPAVPDRCYPTEGASNNWGFQLLSGAASGSGSVGSVGLQGTRPTGITGGRGVLSQDVKVCPGTAYDIDFWVMAWTLGGACSVTVRLGNRLVTNFSASGSFPPQSKSYGPFRITPNSGDGNMQGFDLHAQLGFDFSCPGVGFVQFSSVSIHAA